jgi:hypothetical protein
MISDDHHLDEARTLGLGDERVDVQRIQVGNQADQGRRGCWVQMFVGESGRVEGGFDECGAEGPGHKGGK